MLTSNSFQYKAAFGNHKTNIAVLEAPAFTVVLVNTRPAPEQVEQIGSALLSYTTLKPFTADRALLIRSQTTHINTFFYFEHIEHTLLDFRAIVNFRNLFICFEACTFSNKSMFVCFFVPKLTIFLGSRISGSTRRFNTTDFEKHHFTCNSRFYKSYNFGSGVYILHWFTFHVHTLQFLVVHIDWCIGYDAMRLISQVNLYTNVLGSLWIGPVYRSGTPTTHKHIYIY